LWRKFWDTCILIRIAGAARCGSKFILARTHLNRIPDVSVSASYWNWIMFAVGGSHYNYLRNKRERQKLQVKLYFQSTFAPPYAVKTVLAMICATATRSRCDLRNGTSDGRKVCSPWSAEIRAILWL